MSLVEVLRKTPKGQLQYERNLNSSKFNNDLDQYSSPPLSGPHTEKEFSLMNLSFGLELSDFSNRSSLNNSKDVNNMGSLNNSYNVGDLKDNLNNSNRNNESTLSVSRSNKSTPSQKLSILKALTDLDDVLDNEEYGNEYIKLKLSNNETPPVDNDVDTNITSLKAVTSPKGSLSFSQYGITSCAILDEERSWNTLTHKAMHQRRCQFDKHEKELKSLMNQKTQEATAKLVNLVNQKEHLIGQLERESQVRASERLLKLKEGHEEHQKKIVTKHQEIERQREKLEEEEKKRHEQELAKLQQLKSAFSEFQQNRASFVNLWEGFECKDKLPEVVDKYRMALDQVFNTFKEQLIICEKNQAVPGDLAAKFVALKDQSLQKVELLKQQIVAVSKQIKESEAKEEEQRQLEKEKQEQEKRDAEKALDFRVQSMAYVLKDRQVKEKALGDMNPIVRGFTVNAQMKKYRFDLQRAVNTPINAISAVSGSHLRDKLQSLQGLLSGRQVHVAGKQVSAGQSPEGMAFSQNLIAKMLVKKGEEQVTSNHESAFAIAAVAVGLWSEFPVVGDLFLAHLQSVCPYVLPYYFVKQEGQSTQDYYRCKGYKIEEDGTVEEQDKFLHRMSGVMRLYCACLVSTVPKRNNPHGLEHAWTWLCRTLNMEPQPDITAAMMFDMLEVTGHFLFSEYRNQFVKLLHFIYKVFLPKLKEVSITNSTVGRLEIFLENCLRNNAKVEPPKGLLPPNFLFS